MSKTRSTIIADYPVVEVHGDNTLILGLGKCGRMFNVELPAEAGEPTDRAELVIASLDETGCPQGATFKRFI